MFKIFKRCSNRLRMKVYGIYEGCIHEGGSVDETLYKSKEDVIKNALILVESENKEYPFATFKKKGRRIME